MSSKVARRKRWVLMWAQACVCPSCGGMLNPDAETDGQDMPTLDHIQTWGRGGANANTNLLVKHRRCNEIRGDKEATARDAEALKLVAERLKSRPETVVECEAAARAIFTAHLASRLYQPNSNPLGRTFDRLAGAVG